MEIQYIERNYLKYNLGKGYICGHIDALHAMQPAADKHTDKIVEGLVKEIGCAGIVSTVSRLDCDLNREPNGKNDSGISEYRSTIKDILMYLHILDSHDQLVTPYLHLSFHGMKDSYYGPFAIEVGTQNGKSCSSVVRDWLEEALKYYGKDFSSELTIVFDKKFKGDKSIIFHRCGDQGSYKGYGAYFHSFQIELSRTIRRKHIKELITLFSKVFTDFQSKFVTFDRY